MKIGTISIIILLSVIVVISGCATTGSLDSTWKKRPKRLKAGILDYSFDEVYEASKLAILNLGLALDSEGKEGETSVLYAKSTANMAKIFWFGTGYGEMIGIYVTPISENQTEVNVAIQKKYLLDMGYKDYRGLVINQIKNTLELKKR